MAAPPMNPTIAACDKNSMRKPNLKNSDSEFWYTDLYLFIYFREILLYHAYLRNPRVAWVIPAKKVAVKARRKYSSLFLVESTSFCRSEPSRRETTATGPIAISFELPMAAYINGGMKLESETKKKVNRS
jgi:hypothetical protein